MVADAHERQKRIWDDEHRQPFMFPFVASTEPNPGVVRFWDWLESQEKVPPLKGLEICCGKGRNAIWLAGKGVEMQAFDFSQVAIDEANKRLERLTLPVTVEFRQQDATARWPYPDDQFDFAIDCFGSSDIESASGRRNVLDESLRVLKPGGFFCQQIDSPELGFFAERYLSSPGPEPNTLLFPNGKVEAILKESDLEAWAHSLKLIVVEKLVETTHEIFGQTAPYRYYWIVAQAPG